MVDSDVMKGLPFNQKRGNDVIHLFQLRWGEGKTGSGFASDQFILFLSIGSLIEMFSREHLLRDGQPLHT